MKKKESVPINYNNKTLYLMISTFAPIKKQMIVDNTKLVDNRQLNKNQSISILNIICLRANMI